MMRIDCDSLADSSVNGNHAALNGTMRAIEGKIGNGLNLMSNAFIQLPATIANTREMSFAMWVNLRSNSNWQRLFDFGNDTEHYVFLTTKSSYSNKMRLAIKNGGSEQTLDAPSELPSSKWTHVAVTFNNDAVTIYLNGAQAATTSDITIRPADIRPIFNYIGRSQFTSDPMLRAYLDDIRIFNYALTADEVAAIAAMTDGINKIPSDRDGGEMAGASESTLGGLQGPFDLSGRKVNGEQLRRGIYIINGKKVRVQ